MIYRTRLPVLLIALLLPLGLLAACGPDEDVPDPDPTVIDEEGVLTEEDIAPQAAEAVLEPTEGNEVSGTVRFTEVDDGIRVEASVVGLSENSLHGFHIHEEGDCSAPDATSAGGHFNPTDTPHGGPDDEPSERHVGDLGNLESDETGQATYDRVDDLLTFEGDASILGRSVIVHADEDDLTSQPVGDAGARLACGIITPVEE